MNAGVQQQDEVPRLLRDEHGLGLVLGKTVVRGDFARMLPRLRPGNLNRELVVRAAKLKNTHDLPLAIDATAGLGEDALLLAAAGFRVRMYERNPSIAALLRDALQRAESAPELAEVVGRMHLCEGDSIQALQGLANGGSPELSALPGHVDVVLLDPMFPDERNRAAAKKKLQLLRYLEEPCEDEAALLNAALAVHPRKVVIKRPAKGPYLAGRKPSYSIAGKAIRFDCIVPPAE